MKAIGIDIGTTSISAVVVDTESKSVLQTITVPNAARIPGGEPWERLQDADLILDTAHDILKRLSSVWGPVDAIGLDGQMHGMVYLNQAGKAVSPLYTWQDGRGDLPYGDSTYAEALSHETGYALRSGYGITTHFWNVVHHNVPNDATSFCSIADYVALRLCGKTAPVMHLSNAASFGAIHPQTLSWDFDALQRAGIPSTCFPEVSADIVPLGDTETGIPVFSAIGDNQASLIGSIRDMENSMLINMGTGGQVSMLQTRQGRADDIESRPLNGNQRVWVGSVLCGGRSYAILESFIRGCARLAGYSGGNLYDCMNQEGLKALENPRDLVFDTRFCGTRREPNLRGSISGISEENFNVGSLIASCMLGMAEEVYELYRQILRIEEKPVGVLIGSGNAIRKSSALRAAFQKRFGLEMLVPAHEEEAAFGACLTALTGIGYYPNLARAQAEMVQYSGAI